MRLVGFVCVGLLIAGCATKVQSLGGTYRVADEPNRGHVTVAANARGALGGMMWRRGDADEPEFLYRRAAEEFLAGSGRICEILGGERSGRREWRFTYRC